MYDQAQKRRDSEGPAGIVARDLAVDLRLGVLVAARTTRTTRTTTSWLTRRGFPMARRDEPSCGSCQRELSTSEDGQAYRGHKPPLSGRWGDA